MNWIEEDIRLSIGQSEFIDTAIIPITKISWGVQAIRHSNTKMYLDKVRQILEKKYRGRIIVFPTLFYCEDSTMLTNFIQPLLRQLTTEEVKYKFLLTTDSEINFENTIYIPNLPIEKLDDENQMIMLNAQVEEIMNNIIRIWNES